MMKKQKQHLNWTCRLFSCVKASLLIIAILLGLNSETHASHLAGSEITYTCLGSNQYEITLTLYRDCSGIAFGTMEFLNFDSGSCGASMAGVNVTAVGSAVEVSQLCPTQLNNSTCGAGTGQYLGIERMTYTAIVTFPQTCTNWVVSWSSCCRNGAVTNLTGPSGLGNYLEAMINTNYCEDSPTFNVQQMPYLCAGLCYDYNFGASNTGNSTLHYALTCPLTAAATCSPYVAGFSATQPLLTAPANSFALNPNTGQASFCTAPGVAQNAVLALTVFQVLNGDTIGYIQRDMQVTVINSASCTNQIEVGNTALLSGGTFDAANNIFSTCIGNTLTFSLIAYDSDGDTIQLDALNTNLNAVFGAGNWSVLVFNDNSTTPPYRPDSLLMFVQIIATPENIGQKFFTIGFTDNACPITGNQIAVFSMITEGIEINTPFSTFCPGITQTLPLTSTIFTNSGTTPSYLWSQTAGPIVNFSNDTIANPVITIPSTTLNGDSIVLSVSFTNGTCTGADEITLYFQTMPLTIDLLSMNPVGCPNGIIDTISLNTNISTANVNSTTGIYTWTALPANMIFALTNTNTGNPSMIYAGNPSDSVSYMVNYAYGLCSASDTIQLTWRSGIPQLSASLDTICSGDTVQLSAILTDTFFVASSSGCSLYTVAPIAYVPIVGAGTSVSLTDDVLSGNLPIGFSFNFYCNTYTQFRISSNGFITFDLATFANGCCTGQVLPDAFDPNNVIALAWEDLNPGIGGTISYFTTGTAPNRKLVMTFNNVPRFGGASTITAQIILHEGTNYIDIHTTSVLADGPTTQGIENATGTIGLAVPGRNSAIWTATNDAYRFVPSNTLALNHFTYSWTPSISLSNATISNPNAFPLGTTIYEVEINEQGCVYKDSIQITINTSTPAPTVLCGVPTTPSSSVLFEWGQTAGATSWEYSLDSGATWVAAVLQDSSLLISGLSSGSCIGVWVRAAGSGGTCSVNAATYGECCTFALRYGVTQNGITLTAIESGPDITYQWIDCNGNIPIVGETGQSFTPTANGNYAVIISDGINTITTGCTSINVLDVNQLQSDLNLVLYPNPTTGLLHLDKNNDNEIAVKITDNVGRQILTTILKDSKNTIDLKDYPTGIYFIGLGNGEKIVTQKIVKQ